jgi:hypothetical protein
MNANFEAGGPPPPEDPPGRRCPNCQGPVSSDADFCPHCGNDLRKRRSSFWPGAVAALVALLVGAGIALAVSAGGNDTTKTVTKKQQVTTTAPTSSTNLTVQTPTRTVTVPGPTQTVTVPTTITAP